VAGFFLKNGYPNIFALQGGWKAWLSAGYPVEKK
jgi:rhodanese-related sulfurtransferase